MLQIINFLPDRKMGRGLKALIENNQLSTEVFDKLYEIFKQNIYETYNEKQKKDFKEKQIRLASFQDSNRGLISSLPQTRLSQLQTDFNLAFNIYSELAKQLESQKIKVKEDTPVFTVIEPVSVPLDRSKPKRGIIIAVWSFLGIVIGVGLIFVKDFISNIKKDTINE